MPLAAGANGRAPIAAARPARTSARTRERSAVHYLPTRDGGTLTGLALSRMLSTDPPRLWGD